VRVLVVIVTGASSGIGRALAIALHKEGARLILAARTTARLEELRNDLMKIAKVDGAEIYIPQVITLDLEQLDSLADKVEEVWGRIDILVNNGGISVRGGAIETSLDIHRRIMDVNYFGALDLTRHVVPLMMKQSSGLVINISSIQGRIAVPHRAAYAASKHALQAWSDSLRAELGGSGVRVMVVSPGYVHTELSRHALTPDGSTHGKMDASTEEGYTADWVAHRILQAVTHGTQEVVLAPLHHRLALLLRVLFPNIYFLLMNRRAAKSKDV